MKPKVLSPGAQKLASEFHRLGVAHPYFHIVLGSGYKEAVPEAIPPSFIIKGEIEFSDVPGLHASTVVGHSGKYLVVEHASSRTCGVIQMGRLHGYEGLDPKEVIRTVMYTRELETAQYFITNAAGGLDPKHQPGDVMLITDHINFTGKNPTFGENPKRPDGSEWGPRFTDLTDLYDREWSQALKKSFVKEGLNAHEGVYVGVLGPSFETPAEIRMFAQWGGHSVGMSTVWETIALKHTGATVTALSLISNLGAGLSSQKLDHLEILAASKASSTAILRGMLKTIEQKL